MSYDVGNPAHLEERIKSLEAALTKAHASALKQALAERTRELNEERRKSDNKGS